ncbi:unnamed protein product [Darwinula stevensoni]|uniref:C-type lectin domain-containing protein n=1 Tax=Darwinula stevensoni TaxID=69355 RepID=A0A7R8XJ77_9CRUS|nr:unnamed protein product [Darwinula stevensoni]CAG0895027.1 unnamed protein product [Darwinula stevensoni]
MKGMNKNMMISSPIQEFVTDSNVQCAIACLSQTNCFSFSVTTSTAGFVTCRLHDTYDPPRTADPDSQLYNKELPSGYMPVLGTNSFVKMVSNQQITWIQSETECQRDGGRLAVPSSETMYRFLNETMLAKGQVTNPRNYFWLGGQSGTNYYIWNFLDGTSLTVTGPG